MKRRFYLLLSSLLVCIGFCSCESTDKPSSLIVPDRDKEGLTGPGVRMGDRADTGTNQVQRLSGAEYAPTEYRQRQQTQPVDGIDFFQYKKKF